MLHCTRIGILDSARAPFAHKKQNIDSLLEKPICDMIGALHSTAAVNTSTLHCIENTWTLVITDGVHDVAIKAMKPGRPAKLFTISPGMLGAVW